MTPPRVYADFNGLLEAVSRVGVPEVEMPITGYGTLRSLASQGIRLAEGMSLLLYEPNDIQCEAVVHFDAALLDPAGRTGAWVAVFDPANIQDFSIPEPDTAHPCLSCAADLSKHLRIHGSACAEVCPNCGASVMEPMSPPDGLRSRGPQT